LAGVIDKDLNVTTCTCGVGQDDADPFQTVDSEFHLHNSILQVVGDGACEYLDGDRSLPVLSEEHWEEEFLAAACSDQINDNDEDCMTEDA